MRYFSKFPLIEYNKELVTNIFRRIKVLDAAKSNATLIFEYTVKDSDKPEIIADKLYGSPDYYWIIFHLNDMLSPYSWIMNTNELEEFVRKKYDSAGGIHHYENEDGIIVNQTEIGARPITNFEHELRINESKRKIKLLDPNYLNQFVEEFKRKVR